MYDIVASDKVRYQTAVFERLKLSMERRSA